MILCFSALHFRVLLYLSSCMIENCGSFAQVLHGAERGEPAALLLSPLKPAFKNLSAVDTSHCGSQFTFFLTAPLQAFCQMVGLTSADSDMVSCWPKFLNFYDNLLIPICSPMANGTAFRIFTMMLRRYSPLHSLSGRLLFVHQKAWIWFGHKFYPIPF